MIFDYTVSAGQLLLLYEFSTGSAATPPSSGTDPRYTDIGISFGVPRDITIGGFQ